MVVVVVVGYHCQIIMKDKTFLCTRHINLMRQSLQSSAIMPTDLWGGEEESDQRSNALKLTYPYNLAGLCQEWG